MKYLDKLNPQPTYYIFLTNNVKDNTIGVLNKWKLRHNNTKIIDLNLSVQLLNNIVKLSPYGVIALIRQTLLDEARKLNVDYAIFFDDDLFIADKDFITQITSDNKDIVGGAYFRTYPMGDLMSYLAKNESGEKQYCPFILRNYQLHKLFKVVAVGGGCMCIDKKVLMDERVNFYPIVEYNFNQKNSSEDFAYCLLASKYGYEVWSDDRFKLCHYQIHKARPWRMKEGNKEYIDFEYQ